MEPVPNGDGPGRAAGSVRRKCSHAALFISTVAGIQMKWWRDDSGKFRSYLQFPATVGRGYFDLTWKVNVGK